MRFESKKNNLNLTLIQSDLEEDIFDPINI